MNCWAFQPSFWAALDRQWRQFVSDRLNEEKAEFYLPAAVSAEIPAGRTTVRVRTTSANWFGVTYREDKPLVEATLAKMVVAGEYPESLFSRS